MGEIEVLYRDEVCLVSCDLLYLAIQSDRFSQNSVLDAFTESCWAVEVFSHID
jgi:hypothetical protein